MPPHGRCVERPRGAWAPEDTSSPERPTGDEGSFGLKARDPIAGGAAPGSRANDADPERVESPLGIRSDPFRVANPFIRPPGAPPPAMTLEPFRLTMPACSPLYPVL